MNTPLPFFHSLSLHSLPVFSVTLNHSRTSPLSTVDSLPRILYPLPSSPSLTHSLSLPYSPPSLQCSLPHFTLPPSLPCSLSHFPTPLPSSLLQPFALHVHLASATHQNSANRVLRDISRTPLERTVVNRAHQGASVRELGS